MGIETKDKTILEKFTRDFTLLFLVLLLFYIEEAG